MNAKLGFIAKLLRYSLIAGCISLAACKEEVYGGLSVRDANEMMALLSAQGVDASREVNADGSYKILVDKKEFSRSITLLSSSGYPRESYRSMAEIFPGDGFIVTPLEQRARLNFALNQELTRTISMVEGVVRARVHVVVPELDYRVPNAPRPTASIAVYHTAAISADDLIAKVRLLVANAVQGLNYRDVSVATFVAGAGTSPPHMNPPLAPSASSEKEQNVEKVKETQPIVPPIDKSTLPWNVILWTISLLAAIAALFYVLRGNKQKA